MFHRQLLLASAAAATLAACASTPSEPDMTMSATAAASSAEVQTEFNMTEPHDVLLAEWPGPHGGLPPFDRADNALFEPAIDEGIARLKADIDRIANDDRPATFETVLVPMEKAGKELGRVSTVFFTLTSNRNTPEIQEIAGRVRPKLSKAYDEITFNDDLFARVKAVYDARNTSGLDADEIRLVEKTYDDFVQGGAALEDGPQERVGEINTRLTTLFNDFSNRVLADEGKMIAVSAEAVASLPDALKASFRSAAEENGMQGYAVANTRSSVDPFLTFSDDRAARQKVWEAFVNRGDNADENDTNDLIAEIVQLRAERAKLLGYESHAHYRMADTMAKTPERANELMLAVWPKAVARVKEEVADMQALADREGAEITIEPWDYRYYAEKVRKDRYALDQNEFKNYFEVNNMIEASYYMADRLYGYQFEEVTGQHPTFHPDVRVFHATNKADGSHVGYLYRDDFARQYKRSGAWQSTYRAQENIEGEKIHPVVSNNNNFTEGAEGEASLISLDDAETLFHEFGHALHALTNSVRYPSLGGTPRDFVEFPSQVHENWVLTPEVLDTYARHYRTGEPMPQELIDKLNEARTFNQGFATVEYLADAIVDMRLHQNPNPPADFDPDRFEREALEELGMPDEIVLRHRLPHFSHLFSSDAYSAGYYSYLWSDVMASDAWAAFEEAGDAWDPATAAKFKDVILATGDSIDRAEAYREFRGRDPEVDALLKNRGFPVGD